MKTRVLCDTNVLVSAFISGGPPSRLVEEAVTGHIELVVPDLVLSELERTLTQKIGFSSDRCAEVLRVIGEVTAHLRKAPKGAPSVTGDADDDAILACAIEAGVDILATGDKHFLPLGEHRGVRILRPTAVLHEIRAG